MNEMISREATNIIEEANKSIEVQIELRQWPCAVAVAFACAAAVTIAWINKQDKHEVDQVA